jgi:hypothetical protein
MILGCLTAVAVWCGAAVAAAVVIGRAIRYARTGETRRAPH